MSLFLSKFAVRALLAIFTLGLAVFGFWLLFVFPIIRQHQIAEYLETHDAKVQWKVGGSLWGNEYLGEYWCTEVVSVEMNNNSEAQELMAWLPGLRSLRRLEIADNDLKDEDLRHLAGLTQLNTLHIERNAIKDEGLAHLRNLYNLTKLGHTTPINQEGVEILSKLPSLELEYLRVDQVTAQDLREFSKLPNIRALDIRRPIGSDWAEAVTICKNLELLSIRDASLSDQQLLAIVQTNPLKRLTLTNVPVGDSVLPHLAGKAKLQRLILGQTEVSYEEMLTQLGPLATTVVLHGDNIALLVSDELPRHFSWEGQPRVKKLDALRHCHNCREVRIEGDIYQGCDLSVLPEMRKLSRVTLDTRLTDESMRTISAIPELTAVTMSGPHEITPSGMKYLQNVSNLKYLDLLDLDLEDAHFKEIGKLRLLREIAFFDSDVTDKSISHLTDLKSLEKLSLTDCPSLTDQALRHISGLSSLAELNISEVSFTDEGLPYLYGMPNLEDALIYNTDCSEDAIDRLEELLPSYRYEPPYETWSYY